MKKIALLALAAAAGTASAQFVVTGPATVQSAGPIGDIDNGTFSAVYAGPNTLFGTLQFTGRLTNPNATGTFASEARWRINTGVGPNSLLAQFQTGGGAAFPQDVDVTLGALVWANTGNTFEFEAYESFNDSGIDAVWENPAFTFDGAVSVTNLGVFADSGTLDTFGSDYDTELALFTADGVLLGANDDAGTGLQSEVSFSSLAIGDYIIVVGGFNSAFADGIAVAGLASGDYLLNLDGVNVASGVQASAEFAVFSFSVVPAPGTAALLGFGGLLAARRRR